MKRDPLNFIQHLEKYVFSMPFCQNKRVLDLGSKEGYGSHLISHTASHITLADCSGLYLAQAKKYYHFLCPVDYIQIDFNDMFPKGEWDTIVAFEVIEHVEDPDNFVREIADHLPKGGQLVFSVPHMNVNPAHLTLFNEKSIKELIEKYLTIERFYIHDSYGISQIDTNNNCYVGVATKL